VGAVVAVADDTNGPLEERDGEVDYCDISEYGSWAKGGVTPVPPSL
jgi:hypothetical protein